MIRRIGEQVTRLRRRIDSLATADLLRLLYVGRLSVVSGILAGALWAWGQAEPEQTFLATLMFVTALLVTGGGYFYSHVQARAPSRDFLYGQVLFDVLLVTGIVHVTGGGESDFAWLYILVISEGALLLPLPGGVLIGALSSILYFAAIVWGHAETLSGSVLLQMALFTVVALATGVVGDRLRRAGLALGVVRTELRRLRLDTSEILGTISTGVMTVDGEGRLAYMNPAARSLLAWEGREMDGGRVLRQIGEVSPGLEELLQVGLREGTPVSRNEVSAARDGDRVTLGVSTTVRGSDPEERTVTAIFQDITRLEKIESLNRRTERLEAVAQLAAAMAHEIRNPLASIRSAVEQFSTPGLEDGDREELTGMVVTESERLSRLLSDFIELSWVRIKRVDGIAVEELLGECVALVRKHPEVERRGVRVDLDPIPQRLTIPGDADLLHRALFNLLLNAVQFSPEGGTVRVSAEDIRDAPPTPGVEVDTPVRIRVRDEGRGFGPGEAARIFDPFFTTREGGTGLGLTVVHRAVEAHHGVVFAESPESGGAEFHLYLPGSSNRSAVPGNP